MSGGPVTERDAVPHVADRASASVGQAVEHASGAGRVSATPVRGPARELEAWFLRVITHPESVAAGRAEAAELERALGATQLEDLVTSSSRLGAADRLAIYHHGYRARLVECVTEDYPVVEQAMGARAFAQLARSYVATRPSRSWDLVRYAAGLAEHIASLGGPSWWPTAITPACARDLARLDWALVEVAHEALAPPVSMAALAAVPPELGGAIRLVPSRALRVLAFDHAVHPLYKAVLDGAAWPSPLEAPSYLAVWRTREGRWRMSLTAVTHALLSALIAGAPLSEALAGVPEDASEDVMRWFGAWMQEGFFAEVVVPSTP